MDAATPNISAPAKLRPQMPDWRLALWLALATLALYSPEIPTSKPDCPGRT
jgi:hypothetical protein